MPDGLELKEKPLSSIQKTPQQNGNQSQQPNQETIRVQTPPQPIQQRGSKLRGSSSISNMSPTNRIRTTSTASKNSPKQTGSWLYSVLKKWTNWSSDEKPKSSPRSVELLCRICEELVASDKLEEHSKICAIKHNIDMKSITCDDRLKRITHSIKKKKKQALTDSKHKLSQQEISLLNNLASISKRAAQLRYAKDNIADLEELLGEVTKINETKVSSMTVTIYSRRIEEVV